MSLFDIALQQYFVTYGKEISEIKLKDDNAIYHLFQKAIDLEVLQSVMNEVTHINYEEESSKIDERVLRRVNQLVEKLLAIRADETADFDVGYVKFYYPKIENLLEQIPAIERIHYIFLDCVIKQIFQDARITELEEDLDHRFYENFEKSNQNQCIIQKMTKCACLSTKDIWRCMRYVGRKPEKERTFLYISFAVHCLGEASFGGLIQACKATYFNQ